MKAVVRDKYGPPEILEGCHVSHCHIAGWRITPKLIQVNNFSSRCHKEIRGTHVYS
jgi:hypothetical protein